MKLHKLRVFWLFSILTKKPAVSFINETQRFSLKARVHHLLCWSYCSRTLRVQRVLNSAFFLVLLIAVQVLPAPAQPSVPAELPALTQCTFFLFFPTQPMSHEFTLLAPRCCPPSLPPSLLASVTFFIKSHTGMQGSFFCSAEVFSSARRAFLQTSTDPTPTEECDQQPRAQADQTCRFNGQR